MNATIKLLAVFFLVNIAFDSVRADEQQNISENQWEQPVDGVSLAMIFVRWMEGGHQKHDQIKIYIKNVSNTRKYFLYNARDRGIQIFYIDSHGTQVPLRNYSDGKGQPNLANIPPQPLDPGHVIMQPVELTPSDLAIVGKYQVICQFRISSQEIGGYNLIQSPQDY